MGVQLPERTPSIPCPLQLAASNKSIKIQRQLLVPQLENKFISDLLISCVAVCRIIFVSTQALSAKDFKSFTGSV